MKDRIEKSLLGVVAWACGGTKDQRKRRAIRAAGDRVYLVLQSSKAGQQIFLEDAQVFALE